MAYLHEPQKLSEITLCFFTSEAAQGNFVSWNFKNYLPTVKCDQNKAVWISTTLLLWAFWLQTFKWNDGKTGTILIEQKGAQKTRVKKSAQGKKNHCTLKIPWSPWVQGQIGQGNDGLDSGYTFSFLWSSNLGTGGHEAWMRRSVKA